MSLAADFRRAHARIMAMVARARVLGASDAAGLQVVQLGLNDEVRDTVERFQEYGFTSVPLPGAEAVVAFVGGARDHGLVVAVDDRRSRVRGLQPGEVAIYNNAGAKVVLKADGSIELTAPGGVVMNTPTLSVTGDIIDQTGGAGRTMAAMRATFNGHVHSNPEGGTVGAADGQM